MYLILAKLPLFLLISDDVVEIVGQVFCEGDDDQGWNYINLHCRDNSNEPVDWWYLYKPPKGEGPYWKYGWNFTYITSKQSGKWAASHKSITGSSMLQFTLSPMIRQTYIDHIALLSYQSKESTNRTFGSSANGLLLADDTGGVWIMHTIPGLAELVQNRLPFPEREIENGHMVMCLSADLASLNEVAKSLQVVQPEILKVQIPSSISQLLPDWKAIRETDSTSIFKPSLDQTDFQTNGKTVNGAIIAKPPGDPRCLYKAFAKNMDIVLDVYGHDGHTKTICTKEYSVRNIDSISLKYSDNIFYINNKTDRFGFAVSTAGPWQRKGGAPSSQYWVCVSTVESEAFSANGGFVICLNHFSIWRSFDLLKVKEPRC